MRPSGRRSAGGGTWRNFDDDTDVLQVYTRTPTMFLDFTLDPGATVNQKVPKGWNGFVYVLQGSAAFGTPRTVGRPHETLQLGAGETLTVSNDGAESESNGPCRFVLVAGQPLNEPIEQHGPFVMNDREGIQQAIRDYQV
jgi:redox-sensitive bicupin YhaK (pirin superfamily)